MSARALLRDIVDGLEMEFEESTSYLNLDTGALETVPHELLGRAEESDGDPPQDLLAWQQDEWQVCRWIVSSDRFVELPSKFDVHEWKIMEDFTWAQSRKVGDELRCSTAYITSECALLGDGREAKCRNSSDLLRSPMCSR